MKGILLMCFNSDTYGKYAYNMAHSIRHYTDLPIHLLTDKESISGIDKSVFTSIEYVDFEKNELGKIDNCIAKIKVIERTPFERTLYLDCDGIMLNNPEQLFAQLEGQIFYTQYMGSGKKSDSINYMWASNEVIWNKYSLPDNTIFSSCQTSIMYFEKGKELTEFYKKLCDSYNNKLKPIEYREMWGRSKQHPDELYYSITMAQMYIVPEDLKPVFFPERVEKVTNILNDYYVLSMYGGNNVKPYALELYDKVLQNILNAKGLNHYYKAHKLYKNKFINTK